MCSDLDATNLQYTILLPQPGEMLSLAEPGALPPAESPAPSLEPADVVDPPLPPVSHLRRQIPLPLDLHLAKTVNRQTLPTLDFVYYPSSIYSWFYTDFN
ncbi:hypothetical protein MKX01_040286 [Papaver californicum]|nr:hypothetical protein MKX01_040286 [Papaver californicum]